jgi:tight adherence protein B
MGLVLGVAVPLLVRVVLNFMAGRRRKRFSDQLSDTLQILSGTLRAGHGLAQGIDAVGREAESPTAEEFRRLTIETRLGRDFIEALSALADRIGSDDFQWIVQAIEIQRDVGGDLAEVLDTVAGTIRDRTRIRRQVSALSAEGRMSAWVLMILPFGLGGMMEVTNPDYVSPLFGSSTGYKLLAVAAVLLIVGGLWLRRIVRPVF